MSLFQIAFHNLNRRRARMLLIMGGLLVGIATAVALFMMVQAMRLELGDRIDEFGANVVITPRGEGMELSYGGTHISEISFNLEQLTEGDLPEIWQIPDRDSINIVSPKIVAAVSAGGQEALLVGIHPQKEFAMKPWFALSRQAGLEPGQRLADLALLEPAADEVLAGAGAASGLGLQPGKLLTINGQEFRVLGILEEMGSAEDGLLYAALPVVQDLLQRPGELSMIEVAAYCNACPVEEIAAQLSEALPHARVTALRQAAQIRGETIDRFSAFAVILAAAALCIAALMVFITMMGAVHERTREIGIFGALGFRSTHVMQIILIETGVTGLMGGLGGYLLGALAARWAGAYLAGVESVIPWQPELILPAVLLAVAVAVMAAIYPAVRAARLDPVEALRFI